LSPRAGKGALQEGAGRNASFAGLVFDFAFGLLEQMAVSAEWRLVKRERREKNP